MSEPKMSIDAVLASEEKVGNITVYPITLARYALMELVGSPFVNGGELTPIALIPTLYIMTQPREKLRGFNSKNIDAFMDNCMEWADEISPSALGQLITRISQSFKSMMDVAPQVPEDENVKKKDQD